MYIQTLNHQYQFNNLDIYIKWVFMNKYINIYVKLIKVNEKLADVSSKN